MTDMREKVRGVILETFNGFAGSAESQLRSGALPGWDSLGHMRLVVALEEAFDVRFPTYLLSQLLDVTSIVHVISDLRSPK